MAKTRQDAPASPTPHAPAKTHRLTPQRTVIALKGTAEWAEWLRRLAGHCGLPVTNTLDVALVEHARRQGFAEPMPKRQAKR